MKLDALRLFNVKRFEGRGVAITGFCDGVNVLAAPNEFGKSTSFEALNALFFVKYSSKSGEVTALKPYSGGAPRVEADITLSSGRYRLTKQFLSKPMAQVFDLNASRIIAQADEAEAFISRLMGDGSCGPAALLWVKQGATGWERRSKSEDEGETSARSELLQSVQGEVEAITGGRRMAEILTATEDALKALVTGTGRPKTGGPYATALTEFDRLEAEVSRLDAEVIHLRDALDRRDANLRRLKEIDTPVEHQARDEALSRSQSRFDTARSQDEALRRLRAELDLAQTNKDSAARDLTQYREALDQSHSLAEALKTLEVERADITQKRTLALAADQEARQATDSAEKAEAEARAQLDACDAAIRAREAAVRLKTLTASLDQALQARQQVEALKAEFAAKTIPASALKSLEDIETQLVRLRAVRDAARPSLSVDYEPAHTATFHLDGTPLGQKEERPYDGHAVLSLPGVGRITLRSNSAEDLGQIAQQEERQRSLLASLGVANRDAARQRHDQAQSIESQIQTETARLNILAPNGIDHLQTSIAACQDLGQTDLDQTWDRPALEATLQAAIPAKRQAHEARSRAELTLSSVNTAFFDITTQHSLLSAQLTEATGRIGSQDQRSTRLSELTTRLSDAEAHLGTAQAAFDTTKASVIDLELAEAGLSRARSAKSAAETEINALKLANATLDAQISTRSDEAVEERRNEQREAFEAAHARVASFEHEIAILQRLRTALDEARLEAKALYLAPVLNELKPLLSLLFEDASITFDDQSLLPDHLIRKGLDEEVECLSGGMREQLSILTRLAFARLMARDGRPVPVILDDALVYSDDDRIEQMFTALHRQAKDQQIIVLTCRQRAFQKLGGNALRLEDWEG